MSTTTVSPRDLAQHPDPVEPSPAAEPSQAGAPAPARTGPRHPRLRRALRVVRTVTVLVALLAGAAVGGTYIVQERVAASAFVDIGGAALTAQPMPVGSADAGVVKELLVAEQDSVTAGQDLARVALTATGASREPRVQVLRAPSAGIVSAVNVAVGGVARAGEPVVTLYDPAKLTFQADVPVEDLRELRLGMAASITGPGLAQPVAATLNQVVPRVGTDPLGDTDRLTVVLVPAADQMATVRTLVPGLQFTATVDTNTAPGRTPAVNSA